MKKKENEVQNDEMEIKEGVVTLSDNIEENDRSSHDDELKKSIDKIMGKVSQDVFNEDIDEDKINAWKAEYKDIYRSRIADYTFFWHKIRRGDYVKIMSDKDLNEIDNIDLKVYYRQDIIIKSSVLYPSEEELDRILEDNAGISTTLADEIMIRSGFGRAQSEKV